MKNIWALVFIILIALYAFVWLAQVWGNVFNAAIFVKLNITFLILIGALSVIYLIAHTIEKTKQLQKDKFLD